MSQHDMNIANQLMPAARVDINAALAALATKQSGTSAPSTTFPNMWWADTNNQVLYRRNNGDSAWINMGTLSDDRVIAKSGNYTVLIGDNGKTILANASGGAFSVSLPPVATAKDGFEITIIKIDSSSNIVTIDGNSSETIEGELTYLLTEEYSTIKIICNGSAWYYKITPYKRLKILDKIILPIKLFTTMSNGTWNVLSNIESSGSNNIWKKEILTSGRVYMRHAVTGSSGGNNQYKIRFRNNTPTTVYESNYFVIGNQSGNEYAILETNLDSGNVTDIDLSTTELKGINSDTNPTFWTIEVYPDITSGGYSLDLFEILLLN